MRERSPGLLAADGGVLAHAVGRGLQRGEIRARAGLAEALSSPLGAAKHAEQKTLPLRLRAEVDEDQSDHDDAALVRLWCRRLLELSRKT
jgi:hypothetical protein